MHGIVLAAGGGLRLRPHTDAVPKSLVPLDPSGTSPLHLTLRNFGDVGIATATVVVGYLADVVEAAAPVLQERYGVALTLVHNDRALAWNNAWSLLLALRSAPAGDVVVVNGDTLHPASFERALLAAPVGDVRLCVDRGVGLAEEEMKVAVSGGVVTTISKQLDPAVAVGEFVGVSLVRGHTRDRLAATLADVVAEDPRVFYEAAYQRLVDGGSAFEVCDVTGAAWTEIDDDADLVLARSLLVHYARP